MLRQYGLVTRFDKFRLVKGIKFASADGIYSNGWLICQEKYLIKSSSYLLVVVMALCNRRIAEVYAYELNGSNVQNTAILVYPDMLDKKKLHRVTMRFLN